MGTHAMIGSWNSTTGEVTASYVHYDGYVQGVGNTLVKSYNDFVGAEIVATGGYLSSLTEDYAASRKGSVHSDEAVTYASVEEYLDDAYAYAAAHYLYLWDGDAWFYTERGNKDKSKFEEVELNL